MTKISLVFVRQWVWQVCHELNVPALFAVGADPRDPCLRVDSVPQGPKQSGYLCNRPVMRLRRPAMGVARESMVRQRDVGLY